ncbi:MAG: hypothetical protein Q4E22_02935 [Coriobacteriia bacterium]|nr:hypothetical protein [Coriobacteriia bacterium]
MLMNKGRFYAIIILFFILISTVSCGLLETPNQSQTTLIVTDCQDQNAQNTNASVDSSENPELPSKKTNTVVLSERQYNEILSMNKDFPYIVSTTPLNEIKSLEVNTAVETRVHFVQGPFDLKHIFIFGKNSARDALAQNKDGALTVDPAIAGQISIVVPKNWTGSIKTHGSGSILLNGLFIQGNFESDAAGTLSIYNAHCNSFIAKNILISSLRNISVSEDLTVQTHTNLLKVQDITAQNSVTLTNTGGSVDVKELESPHIAIFAKEAINFQANKNQNANIFSIIKGNPKNSTESRSSATEPKILLNSELGSVNVTYQNEN